MALTMQKQIDKFENYTEILFPQIKKAAREESLTAFLFSTNTFIHNPI